jgi:hypothetical protein
MTSREAALAEGDARQIAWVFRQKFRNSEAFETAWHALFELRTAVTPSLARRFLGEELLKYRAHLAGLEEPPDETPPTPIGPETYTCPGCERALPVWGRDGHAEGCRHFACYALEVRFREAKARQKPRHQIEAAT